MPSGITSAIYEGKEPVSLRDYLMSVSRQMGYAIMQRDDSLSEPVKPTSVPNFYVTNVEEAEAELAKLDAMTPAEIAQAAEREFRDQSAAHALAKAENAALQARYEDMIRQVEAWHPDKLIASTKDYALRYLRESLEHDCGRVYPGEPVAKEPLEWFLDKRKDAVRHLEFARERLVEMNEREAERNRHIHAFLRSLPDA